MSRAITALLAVAVAVSVASCSNVLELSVGDCFQDWEGATQLATQQVEGVETVDCDVPHDNEVYALVEMTEASFPGAEAVETRAYESCLERFDSFVGTPYADSRLDFGALFPTDASWDQGDRTIICFVYDVEFLRLTGSMEDSGI
ncbi:MAG: septum formation family protein [Armatimonadetes bacterium]|nr:MAG: septum formation family protein [Armatimonadota bacterium]